MGSLLVQIEFQKMHDDQGLEVDAFVGLECLVSKYLMTKYLLHGLYGL